MSEHQYQRQVENSSFGPIQWQTRISRKSAFWLIGPQNPIFRFDHKNTPTGFFCTTRLKTNIYVFSSDSIAVWALVHDQTCENVENPRFWLFFEKVDFWRFWGSGTTRNNGDVQFLVAKSCLAQVFRPGCQVSAQSLNCIRIGQTPQKCDFRGSRQVCVKNGPKNGGRDRTPWVAENNSDHRVMTKNRQETRLGHF